MHAAMCSTTERARRGGPRGAYTADARINRPTDNNIDEAFQVSIIRTYANTRHDRNITISGGPTVAYSDRIHVTGLRVTLRIQEENLSVSKRPV